MESVTAGFGGLQVPTGVIPSPGRALRPPRSQKPMEKICVSAGGFWLHSAPVHRSALNVLCSPGPSCKMGQFCETRETWNFVLLSVKFAAFT